MEKPSTLFFFSFNGPVIKRKRLYKRNFFLLACMSRPWVFLRNRNWKIVSEFLRICHFKYNQIPFLKERKTIFNFRDRKIENTIAGTPTHSLTNEKKFFSHDPDSSGCTQFSSSRLLVSSKTTAKTGYPTTSCIIRTERLDLEFAVVPIVQSHSFVNKTKPQ